MKAATWFRITSVVMLLFAAGHTFGFLTFRPATAEGQAVWAAMNSVHFAAKHGTYSYAGFYLGFGLFVSSFYVFEVWLLWFLARMAERGVAEARTIAWGLCGLQVVGAGLSVRYFAGAPAVLSVVAAICLGMGAVRMRSAVPSGLESRGEARIPV
jgi:hypothetical protein